MFEAALSKNLQMTIQLVIEKDVNQVPVQVFNLIRKYLPITSCSMTTPMRRFRDFILINFGSGKNTITCVDYDTIKI